MSTGIESFIPYKNFVDTTEYIENFHLISGYSYAITKQLMLKHNKNSLTNFDAPTFSHKDVSYCIADVKPSKPEFICGWITCAEYAERENINLEEVELQASNGFLGPVEICKKTSKQLIIWPKEYQYMEIVNLPTPGKHHFRAHTSISAKASTDIGERDISNFDETQQQLLSLIYKHGEAPEIQSKAETMLFQSCFLLYWTAFEVFVKETIHDLFRQHPEKLTKGVKGSTKNLSYADIYNMSSSFSSIDSLRTELVNTEIEKHKRDGESISGLINFLKSEFKFHEDPYTAWYVINGQKKETSILKINEIRDVRNSLVHDSGKDFKTLIGMYPHLSTNEEKLAISEDYYVECSYVLRGIAFFISLMIYCKKYKSA